MCVCVWGRGWGGGGRGGRGDRLCVGVGGGGGADTARVYECMCGPRWASRACVRICGPHAHEHTRTAASMHACVFAARTHTNTHAHTYIHTCTRTHERAHTQIANPYTPALWRIAFIDASPPYTSTIPTRMRRLGVAVNAIIGSWSRNRLSFSHMPAGRSASACARIASQCGAGEVSATAED